MMKVAKTCSDHALQPVRPWSYSPKTVVFIFTHRGASPFAPRCIALRTAKKFFLREV